MLILISYTGYSKDTLTTLKPLITKKDTINTNRYNFGAIIASFGTINGEFPQVDGIYMRYAMFGFGLSKGDGEQSVDPEHDYHIPHDDYYTFEYKSRKVSIDFYYFYDIPKLYISPFISLGSCYYTVTKIDVSKVTGYSYRNSKDEINSLGVGIGIDCMPYDFIYFGLMYHTVNQFSIRLGYKFSAKMF